MEQPGTDSLVDQYQQMLADHYAQLRLDLIRLQSEPCKDMVAIDAAMEQIDTVQAQLKALNGRAGDPQRY